MPAHQLISRRPYWLLVLAAVASLGLSAFATAPAQAKKLPPPPKITPHHGAVAVLVRFEGKGTYEMTSQTVTPSGAVHGTATLPFQFEADFTGPTPKGMLTSMPGVLFTWQASASAKMHGAIETPQGVESVDGTCPQAPVIPAGGNPALTVGSQIKIQSATKVQAVNVPACEVTFSPFPASGPPPAEPLNGEYITLFFNLALPDALTAVLPAGAAKVPYGVKKTYDVSSAENPLPTECAPGAEECQSLTWSGTVTIEGRCTTRKHNLSTVSWCVDKRDAVKAAKAYRKKYLQDRDEIRRVLKCGSPSKGKSAFSKPVFTCIYAGIKDGIDYNHMLSAQQAANDPPEGSYQHVAKAKPMRAAGLKALRGPLPKLYRLTRSEAETVGLERALIVSLDRSTGASDAILDEKQHAEGPLRRQKDAILRFGKKAAKLLGAQRHLATAAAGELRGRATHEGGRAAKADRQLAASLTSPSERKARSAQIRWLSRFGS